MVNRDAGRALVERYFAAMVARAAGAGGMADLFSPDAVYIEPFSGGASGQKRTHVGSAAISAFFDASWQHQPPDMTVSLDRMDLDGDTIRSEWTCRSPVFPGPMRGYDVVTVRNGKIARLETTLLGPNQEPGSDKP